MSAILPAVWVATLLLVSPVAAAAEPAVEEPAVEEEEEEEAFVIPDGFRAKKRGEFTVYCRKEPVLGTRLPAERCYDENGIRALAQELREHREKVDQLRRVCSSQAACGAN